MKRIVDKRRSELSGGHGENVDWWRHPWSPEEIENLCITMLDFEEAAKLVQLSSRIEGFSSIPNIRWEDVGGLDSLRKAFDRYIIQRIKHPEDYEITGIPVLFISAVEGRGGVEVMHQVVDAYQNWCSRLSTARLNRWLRKVMSKHSSKDQAAQPKIKYFTQVKARPLTFVSFLSGKAQLSYTDIRFLIKSLKEDFNLGGIPIRIMQRCISTKTASSNNLLKGRIYLKPH